MLSSCPLRPTPLLCELQHVCFVCNDVTWGCRLSNWPHYGVARMLQHLCARHRVRFRLASATMGVLAGLASCWRPVRLQPVDVYAPGPLTAEAQPAAAETPEEPGAEQSAIICSESVAPSPDSTNGPHAAAAPPWKPGARSPMPQLEPVHARRPSSSSLPVPQHLGPTSPASAAAASLVSCTPACSSAFSMDGCRRGSVVFQSSTSKR